MVKGKRGAEESNIIIFIILALVVAGLVIFFSWNFFSKGSDMIDINDFVTKAAIQSCQLEINSGGLEGYCYTPKTIKLKDGKTQIVNCKFIEVALKGGLTNFTGTEGIGTCKDEDFIKAQCRLFNMTQGETVTNKTRINNRLCSEFPSWN